jgi:protein TonB
MAVGDGSMEKVGNDPVQSGSLLSLLPSLLIHGAIVIVIWLGLFEAEEIQPPVTFISLAPAAAPAPEEPAPPAPSVPAPELEPEFEPLPLPETGMVLPQPEPPAEPAEPVMDYTPPELPELESFPFDPKATRTPEPEPEDAAPIEKAEKPKPKAPEKKEAKAKPKPKPKKEEVKKAAAPAKAESKPAQNATPTQSAAAPAKTAPSTPPKPATNPRPAAISDAPVRVTNPNYAGACPISYPERARKRNQEGTVVIHALIGQDGKPIEVNVAQSSGHRLLDEAAREAISDCAFVPQKVGGRAVKAIVEIPIPFKLI